MHDQMVEMGKNEQATFDAIHEKTGNTFKCVKARFDEVQVMGDENKSKSETINDKMEATAKQLESKVEEYHQTEEAFKKTKRKFESIGQTDIFTETEHGQKRSKAKFAGKVSYRSRTSCLRKCLIKKKCGKHL